MMEGTLNYKGIDFDIEYIYTPEEKEIRYPNDKAQPGEPATVELTEIKHKLTCFMEFFEDEIEIIESLILKKIQI